MVRSGGWRRWSVLSLASTSLVPLNQPHEPAPASGKFPQLVAVYIYVGNICEGPGRTSNSQPPQARSFRALRLPRSLSSQLILNSLLLSLQLKVLFIFEIYNQNAIYRNKFYSISRRHHPTFHIPTTRSAATKLPPSSLQHCQCGRKRKLVNDRNAR